MTNIQQIILKTYLQSNIMISQEINNNEEEIEVLYNDCYGSWRISNKARKLYVLRRANDSNNNFSSKRSDPILIQIYNELGNEFDSEHSKTAIKKISKKYEYYYFISEYDGLETVEIDYTKYELDNLKQQIKDILENNSIDNDEKINQLIKINKK